MILFSCEKTIDPFVGQFEKKLVINSEIQPNKPIYLFVSTSVSLNQQEDPFRPEDFDQFKAYITVNDQIESPEEILFFEKDEDDGGGLTWRTRRSFNTKELQNLKLQATLYHEEYTLSANAETTIPSTMNIDTINYLGIESIEVNESYSYRVEMKLPFGETMVNNNFHLLAAHEGKSLSISHFGQNESAIEYPHHHVGALIHGDQLGTNTLSFLVHSDKQLETLNIELRNCTDSYMDYHISLSRSYSSQNSPFNEPTLNYSNIENGLGVFTSFSSFVAELDLK